LLLVLSHHDAGHDDILPHGCQEGRDGSRDTKPAGHRHPRQRVSLGSGRWSTDAALVGPEPEQPSELRPEPGLASCSPEDVRCIARTAERKEAANTKRALLVIYGFDMPRSYGPQMMIACRSSSTAALCVHVSSRSPDGQAGGRRKLASGTRQEGRWRRGLRVLLAPHLPPRPHQPRWRPGGCRGAALGASVPHNLNTLTEAAQALLTRARLGPGLL
jgi:hypothetical protein